MTPNSHLLLRRYLAYTVLLPALALAGCSSKPAEPPAPVATVQATFVINGEQSQEEPS